jgi:NAD(P)-dependent dehydrogenase (short-subunit alcohol dehydrogenase family)
MGEQVPQSADLFDLSGKVAVVTGASSGLGAYFAQVLADAGAAVALAARRTDRLAEVQQAITDAGGRAISVECDVADPESTEALMAAAHEQLGGLDIAVANAGIASERSMVTEKLPIEFFNETLAVNLTGAFNTCQAAGRRMLAQGSGAIINVSSVAGLGASYETPAAYSASKAGLISLTQHLALRWGRRGVRVNALAPGWFPSEMTETPLGNPAFRQRIENQTANGRPGELQELAGPLLLLASDAGSYTTGTTLIVDGGTSASLGEHPPSPEMIAANAERWPDGLGEPIMPSDA